MLKSEVIKYFESEANTARVFGVSRQAVNKWPEVLTRRILANCEIPLDEDEITAKNNQKKPDAYIYKMNGRNYLTFSAKVAFKNDINPVYLYKGIEE